MDSGTTWLQSSLVYLGAAVLAVPLARLAGLGSIIGYLAAGIVIGPWGLKLATDAQAMLHFAEFGVVLMLFLVGLELEPRRLWALRRPIFGWGSAQLFGSAAVITAIGMAFGADWRLALVAGLGLALTSTAIGLGVLNERNLMSATTGQNVLSVALLQDIAAIPILAIVPLLAVAVPATSGNGWIAAAKAFAVIAAIILGGRLLLRPALRWIAGSNTPEVFTAAALLLVVATAALMQSVGLSMVLGAFLAGVLLAESEYRRKLETDLEPFKGLLLGLFFIAVGMSINFAVIAAHLGLVAAIVVGFLIVKLAVLLLMAWRMPVPLAEPPVFAVLLAQGGEFGFVVFQAALGAAVIGAEAASVLVAAVAISMLLTPLLLVLSDPVLAPRLAANSGPRLADINEEQLPADHHLRLRPLRPDRRPVDCRQRPQRHGAGPQRRGRGQLAHLRLAGLLRRRDAAGSAACGRCRQSARDRGGGGRCRAKPGHRRPGARALHPGHGGGARAT